MARQAKAIPKAWKDRGVWYVLDVDGQHALVDEHDELEARLARGEKLTAPEAARLDEIRRQISPRPDAPMGDLLAAKVLPYSHDEYARIESAKIGASMKLTTNPNGGVKVSNVDARALTLGIQLDIIETRVVEITGYSATRATKVDEATGEVLETRSTPIRTGADLAAWFRADDCPDTETEVMVDLFKAITSQSHLETGLGKAWASRRASSPATTRPLAGDAPGAIPTTSTPATT